MKNRIYELTDPIADKINTEYEDRHQRDDYNSIEKESFQGVRSTAIAGKTHSFKK